MRISGDARGVEICVAVAGGTCHPWHSVPVFAARDRRLIRAPAIGLPRSIGSRMTVHAARVLQNLAGLLEQSNGTALAIRDRGEALDRPQLCGGRRTAVPELTHRWLASRSGGEH